MELFAMGGYGPFVWSSYFLTLLVVIISVVQARRRQLQVEQTIRQGLKVEESKE
jgi:heme exporter protein CcmD